MQQANLMDDPYKTRSYLKYLALLAGWLAWTFDGMIQNIYNIMSGSALKEIIPGIPELVERQSLLHTQSETLLAAGQTASHLELELLKLAQQIDGSVGWYFSVSIAMWLWGAAAGGILFGMMGDRFGRSRTLIFAVLTYSIFTGLSVFSTHWTIFCLCRFLGAMGLGGAWPLSVALMMETWEEKHRPVLAGLLGAGANVGYLFAAMYSRVMLEYDFGWRPIIGITSLIGLSCLLVIVFVPEPAQWKVSRQKKEHTSIRDLFTPQYRRSTITGMLLATVALMGAWGTFLWMPIYVAQITEATGSAKTAKAAISIWQSCGQITGAFLGGLIAGWMGNKKSYCFLCILAWLSVVSLFAFNDTYGLQMILMGTVSGVFVTAFFGWLPKYLPELFPTRIRTTGQGFCYNAGRVIAGLGVLGTGWVVSAFKGDYQTGVLFTATIYLTGLIVIYFTPKTSGKMIRVEEKRTA